MAPFLLSFMPIITINPVAKSALSIGGSYAMTFCQKMKIITLLIFYTASFMCGYSEVVNFPTNTGEVAHRESKVIKFTHNEWEYVYEIQSKGTRSEKRIGRLYQNGKEVKGEIGDLCQKPIGIFVYFGESGYNRGWLNTMTRDQKVFTKKTVLTPKVVELLKAIRPKKKMQNKTEKPTPHRS